MKQTLQVTQYLRPHGTKRRIFKEVSDDVHKKGMKIIEAGYQFEAEVLRTGDVSFTIYDPKEGVDVAIKLVTNGPKVHEAFDKLINTFNIPNSTPLAG